jgi:hypothetical protein
MTAVGAPKVNEMAKVQSQKSIGNQINLIERLAQRRWHPDEINCRGCSVSAITRLLRGNPKVFASTLPLSDDPDRREGSRKRLELS